jgi:SAM-dependent methyltransferase
MTDTSNAQQIEYWNGPTGERWARLQERIDLHLADITEAALGFAAPKPGERILDIGCGCGTTTFLLALEAGAEGAATGVDVSVPMLNVARARAMAQNAGIAFLQADASTYEFQPIFDLIFSRFGIMFFADPVAAFANIRSATRPGGRLAFACWQPLVANQWLLVPRAALLEHVPPPAGFGSTDGPGMFAFAEPERVGEILTAAGWQDIEITSEHVSILYAGGGSVEDAAAFLRTGSTGRMLLAGADADTVDRAMASARTALARYADAEGVHLGAAVWLVRAVAP